MPDQNPSGPSSRNDKDRSRQMSRPVGAKGNAKSAARPAAKAGGKGQRPPRNPSPAATPRRSPTTLLTWGTVALVLVIVVVLVVIGVTKKSNTAVSGTTGPAPAVVVNDLSTVPTTVFNKVAVETSSGAVAPSTVSGQPALTSDGKPEVLFYGAEYCPYCAAERWALVAALDRFGKFTNLGATESSASDIYASTPTLDFYGATYSSPYISFDSVETNTNQLNSAGTSYATLQTPTKTEVALIEKYDNTKYVKTLQSSQDDGSIPFVDFGNKVLQSGASFSPAILTGLTREEIAADLVDPTNPVTQAIVATANYFTAAICEIDGGKPSNVCNSSGVQAAAKSLGITIS